MCRVGVRFSEVEVDQARDAGVVIEFERYAELAVMPSGAVWGRRFRLVWTRARRCPGQRVGLERNPVGAWPGPALLFRQAELWRLLRSVARNSGRSGVFDLV